MLKAQYVPLAIFASEAGHEIVRLSALWFLSEQYGSIVAFVPAVQFAAIFLASFAGPQFIRELGSLKVSITADFLRATLCLALVGLSVSGASNVFYLVLIVVFVSALKSLFEPSFRAMVPSLTASPERLINTNRRLDASARCSRIIAPGVAGVLGSVAITAGVSALLFLACSLVTFLLFRSSSRLLTVSERAQRNVGLPATLRMLQAQDSHIIFLMLGHALLLASVSSVVYTAFLLYAGSRASDIAILEGVGVFSFGVTLFTFAELFFVYLSRGKHVFRTGMLCASIITACAIILLGFLFLLDFGFMSSIGVFICLIAVGIGGPIYSIGLITVLQTELPSESVSRVLHARNIIGGVVFVVILSLSGLAYQSLPPSAVAMSLGVLLFVFSLIGVLRVRS